MQRSEQAKPEQSKDYTLSTGAAVLAGVSLLTNYTGFTSLSLALNTVLLGMLGCKAFSEVTEYGADKAFSEVKAKSIEACNTSARYGYAAVTMFNNCRGKKDGQAKYESDLSANRAASAFDEEYAPSSMRR
jgi:hypothetical protein